MSQLKYKKNSQVHTVGVSSVDGQTGDAHIAVVSSTEPDYGTLWINPDETGNGIDATPTAGSENLVTSGGVKSALDLKVNTADVGNVSALSYTVVATW